MIALPQQRIIITRLVFLFIFLFLVFRFCIGATVSHFINPPLKSLNFDFTYWAFDLIGIPDLITHNQVAAICFDIILFLLCLLCTLYPLKKVLFILFGIFLFTYAVLYNMYIVHHAHPLTIFVLVWIPFSFAKNTHWEVLWQGFRYYVCFIYTMSFIWKAAFGKALFYWNQGTNSVKGNLVEFLYHNPDSSAAKLYSFLIVHSQILNVGNILLVLLEGAMVIGFFTKRWDNKLLFIPIIIHGLTYIFSDVFFLEMLVGVFAFLSIKNMVWIRHRLPFIQKPLYV